MAGKWVWMTMVECHLGLMVITCGKLQWRCYCGHTTMILLNMYHCRASTEYQYQGEEAGGKEENNFSHKLLASNFSVTHWNFVLLISKVENNQFIFTPLEILFLTQEHEICKLLILKGTNKRSHSIWWVTFQLKQLRRKSFHCKWFFFLKLCLKFNPESI